MKTKSGKKVKVAILGAGYMGGVHARNLVRQKNVSVTAVCSRSREPAMALVDSVLGHAARVYTSFDRMLREEPLDAVYVCLPPFAHNGQVEKAAGQGLHVFIEKPLALTVDRARSMVRAVRRAGVIAQVGYHMRFNDAVRLLKTMIDNGDAGVPTLFNGRYECNALHGSWWRKRLGSGGQVLEQAIHLYDLAFYLFGAPRTVSGHTANLCHRRVPRYTIEDTSVSALKFKNGALAAITGSNCAVPFEWNAQFSVICGAVTARFHSLDNAEFVFTGSRVPRRRTIVSKTDPYLQETKSFIAAVRGERPPAMPIDDGLTGLRMVDAVLESTRQNGRPITLR